ncbi:hypothetical protein BHC46_08140 [Snodgrassella alvi]|uniref:Uncharacterized protein n=1 Tax=Snodgrassella alvi TaxID=1196083 RepID=A0A2N9XDZ6_9NEIS|nr:hypothetical protein BGI31_09000 [Snodgrassella communis]PIT43962.1 hypothetical protein BHC46_11925 [Snodgrassella alvi]PIT20044.1 hypothetical protein BGI36_09390 [Snodgrassella communis]PIT24812.1 hypothetical protein BGI35_00395 [Snodgrassella communis]PIT45452.1 hypothetical protein BHC46_10150 [Snodgrassella alvi]
MLPVKPEDKFKTGDYIGGVKILATNLNAKSQKLKQQNKPWKDKDILYLQATVGSLTEMAQKNIQQAAATDYDTRIKNYQLLLALKTELEDKSYSSYILYRAIFKLVYGRRAERISGAIVLPAG